MAIDPDDVFAELECARKDGSLSASICDGKVRYQISQTIPGMLERILPNGRVQIGRFVDGAFRATDIKTF